MDLLILGLVISIFGNIIQLLGNVCRMYINCYKYQQQVNEEKKRASYEDLKDPDGIWI